MSERAHVRLRAVIDTKVTTSRLKSTSIVKTRAVGMPLVTMFDLCTLSDIYIHKGYAEKTCPTDVDLFWALRRRHRSDNAARAK
jgi:hypothetical protein